MLIKPDLEVQQNSLIGQFVEQKIMVAIVLSVTKHTTIIALNCFTLFCSTFKFDLEVQKMVIEASCLLSKSLRLATV